ncbi:MAG: hypothetical protein ACPHHS_05385 [Candidatus Poseidoniaceae archaeon]
MQEVVEALERIPAVLSVELLKDKNQSIELDPNIIQRLLKNREKITLIGKNGCAILFEKNSSILLIRSESKVNLGAIDLVLDSIE